MSHRLTTWLLMAPGLLWLTLLMIVPCAIILVTAFYERGVYGGVEWSAAKSRKFCARRRMALSLDLPQLSAHRRNRHRARTVDRLSRCLRHNPNETGVADRTHLPGHPAILDELSDQNLCLDRAPQPGRTDQFEPAKARRDRVAAAAPLQRVRGDPRPRLQLRALRHTRSIFALQRLDPSYAEASRDLGAGAWVTFFRITCL